MHPTTTLSDTHRLSYIASGLERAMLYEDPIPFFVIIDALSMF